MSGALGALITGVDLASLSDAEFDAIHDAFLRYAVIFFEDQELDAEAYLAFARRFGALAEYPFAKGLEGYPEIVEIIKEPHQTSNFGGMWHTDTTYQPNPPKATMLYAIETPAAGGDTLFADTRLAYDRLSPPMQGLLGGLRAVNSSSLNASLLRGDHLKGGSMGAKAEAKPVLEAEHPVVRVHPETGRKSLFVNPSHTGRFAGFTREESKPILDFLFTHIIKPEYTCRFRWRPGSIAVWDNRSTQHCAINDYDGFRRVMRRITIGGAAEV
jgi:taurine dioxygenase